MKRLDKLVNIKRSPIPINLETVDDGLYEAFSRGLAVEGVPDAFAHRIEDEYLLQFGKTSPDGDQDHLSRCPPNYHVRSLPV